MKNSLLIFILLLLFSSCKKEKENATTSSNQSTCDIRYTVTSDTNYLPFSHNNQYSYCNDVTAWDGAIKTYTSVGKTIYFDFNIINVKTHLGAYYRYIIDSLGRYYKLAASEYPNPGVDTLLLIDPKANNGDTLYKNYSHKTYVILIDKNYTLTYQNKNHPNCYYIQTFINGAPENDYFKDSYYKKGVGLILWQGNPLDGNY